jgi:hypothetical protein
MAEVYRFKVATGQRDFNALGSTVILTVAASRIAYIKSIYVVPDTIALAVGTFAVKVSEGGNTRYLARHVEAAAVAASGGIRLENTGVILNATDTMSIETEAVSGAASNIDCIISFIERENQPA